MVNNMALFVKHICICLFIYVYMCVCVCLCMCVYIRLKVTIIIQIIFYITSHYFSSKDNNREIINNRDFFIGK